MLKILQARLQQYIRNHEIPDTQADFRKGRGTSDKVANIWWIIENAREFQKNIYFCFIGYAKAIECVDLHKLWKTMEGSQKTKNRTTIGLSKNENTNLKWYMHSMFIEALFTIAKT